MVTVCLICGDRRFGQVMVNCPECQDSPQHIYCLDVTPVKYSEKEFTWVCDECKSVSVPTKSHHNQKSKKGKKVIKKSNKEKVQICENCPPEHETERSEHCDNVLEMGNQSGHVLEDQVNSSHDLAASVKTPQMASGDPSKVNEDCYIPAQPIIDPAWRGSLSIMNKDFSIISGLVAHISSLACAKVFEEAKLLPMLLFPDLVCRVDVWPKKFESTGPNDQSIALYFFPDSKSNEKDFDNLVVSMIQEDLAMRAVLDSAELLVFTSSVLPEPFQRFRTKLYLWGAFRGKQSSPLTNNNAPRDVKDLAKPITCSTESPVSPLTNNNAPRDVKDLAKPITCSTESPVSPLSNNVHCGSESR